MAISGEEWAKRQANRPTINPIDFNKRIPDPARIPGSYNANTDSTMPIPQTTSTVPAPPRAMSSTSTPAAPNTNEPTQFADWQAKQNDLMKRYEGLANSSFKYDPENDPRYKAYQQLAKNRAGVASQAAMETLNQRGILNSSVTGTQLGQIQQNAEQEALSAVPQFYSEARSEYQDRLNNAAKMLEFAAGRGDVAYERDYTERRDAREDQVADQERQDKDKAARIKYAENLRKEFGVDVPVTQEYGLMDKAVEGRMTLEGRQKYFDSALKLAEAVQEVTPELEQLTGIPAGTPLWKAKEFMAKNEVDIFDASTRRISANASSSQAQTSAGSAGFKKLMDIWKATGVAPEGIPNVAPGTPYYDPVAARQPETPKPTESQSRNDTEARIYALTPEKRAALFTDSEDSQELIRILGRKRFDELKTQYRIK